jgi:hypothetical protein
MCEKDNAIPIEVQENMIVIAQKKAPKSFAIIERTTASHSPFLSMPDKLANFLIKVAESV